MFDDANLGGAYNRPRSLVWTDWCRSYVDSSWKYLDLDEEPRVELSLAEIFYSRGIQLRFGEFARFAASDESLRYCPECISDGFHSVLCQFDAIAACPRHGIPLLDFCRSCGQPTGPLSLNSELLEVPFCCGKCHARLGHAAPRSISRWVETGCSQGYDELALRLEELESVCRLVGSSWQVGQLEDKPQHVDRLAAFAAGLATDGLSAPAILVPAIENIRCTAIGQHGRTSILQRTAIPDPASSLRRRHSYIRAQFETWKSRVLGERQHRLSMSRPSSVQMAAQRGNTNPVALGTTAAIARLEQLVKECSGEPKYSPKRSTRPYFDELPDPEGWRNLFQRVLEEELFKASEWRAALDDAEEGSYRWHQLIAVYAEPFHVGKLSAAVYGRTRGLGWQDQRSIIVANFGAASRGSGDWYGFSS